MVGQKVKMMHESHFGTTKEKRANLYTKPNPTEVENSTKKYENWK